MMYIRVHPSFWSAHLLLWMVLFEWKSILNDDYYLPQLPNSAFLAILCVATGMKALVSAGCYGNQAEV